MIMKFESRNMEDLQIKSKDLLPIENSKVSQFAQVEEDYSDSYVSEYPSLSSHMLQYSYAERSAVDSADFCMVGFERSPNSRQSRPGNKKAFEIHVGDQVYKISQNSRYWEIKPQAVEMNE